MTSAYFTQSDTKDTGNIVSIEQLTLDYQDDINYMRSDLIPINEEDLVKCNIERDLEDNKEFLDRIKECRLALGMTQ